MGKLFQIATDPLGQPTHFASEQDMETFLFEHPGFLAEHLASSDDAGEILRIWRQRDLPMDMKRRTWGRMDLVFVLQDGSSYSLYIAELKNVTADPGAVRQLEGYLEGWKGDGAKPMHETVVNWLIQRRNLSADKARAIVESPQGLVVAPSFDPKAIDRLGAWAKAHPRTPVQALKLHRFRSSFGGGYLVFVDDLYVVHRPGTRRTIRWTELNDRYPELITEETRFELLCGGKRYEATPVFQGGQGKNLRLAFKHREKALAALDAAVARCHERGHSWVAVKVEQVHDLLTRDEGIPMSNLMMYLQLAFGGEKEPSWETPAGYWKLKGDRDGRSIMDLDALIR